MKHIACCSFGKDSIATIILAHEHNEPLDLILYGHVWYDKEQGWSGEVPAHIKFINEVAIPQFKAWGYEVKVLDADSDYKTWFKTKVKRGPSEGMARGYPIPKMCGIARDLKFKPIKKYLKTMEENIIQYVGIAVDEPKRLARVHETDDQVSLLEKYNFTEYDASKLCEKYGLLSPLYMNSERGGCWFCPNAKLNELTEFREQNRDMWNDFLELDKIEPRSRTYWNYSQTPSDIEKIIVRREQQFKLF